MRTWLGQRAAAEFERDVQRGVAETLVPGPYPNYKMDGVLADLLAAVKQWQAGAERNQCATCKTTLTADTSVFLWFCLHALCTACAAAHQKARGALVCDACGADALEESREPDVMLVRHPLVPSAREGTPMCLEHGLPVLNYCTGCDSPLCDECASVRDDAHAIAHVNRELAARLQQGLTVFSDTAKRVLVIMERERREVEEVLAEIGKRDAEVLRAIEGVPGDARRAALAETLRRHSAAEAALLRAEGAWLRQRIHRLLVQYAVTLTLMEEDAPPPTVAQLTLHVRRCLVNTMMVPFVAAHGRRRLATLSVDRDAGLLLDAHGQPLA